MPVLPVVVSQAEDLLLLVHVASTGGSGERRAQDREDGEHHHPLHSVHLVDSQPDLARQSSLFLSLS